MTANTQSHTQRVNATITKTARVQASCKVCRNVWYTFGVKPGQQVRCPICTDGGRPVVMTGGAR